MMKTVRIRSIPQAFPAINSKNGCAALRWQDPRPFKDRKPDAHRAHLFVFLCRSPESVARSLRPRGTETKPFRFLPAAVTDRGISPVGFASGSVLFPGMCAENQLPRRMVP